MTKAKSNMMSDFVIPIAVLVIICMVMSGLLALTNGATAPIIAAAEAKAQKEAEREAAAAAKAAEREAAKAEAAAQREAERAAREAEHEAERAAKAEAKQREQMAKTVNSVIGQIGREAGRQLMRGLFGNLRR